ncbi:uncharacterized protein LOC103379857 [Cynoglossus semilaevis]|uniref:uncharacterized protein LOC103379857 n=1 Tax=Cynoglossus semilaevis TaxID=244447 RepID=UPI000495A127|nr:uncharacterized protein LOC103379857 [Cynoglossus semilaevis]
MEMLLHMPADPYGIITQDDSKIRREIKNMDFYMNSSQKVAVHALEGIDRETEELTAELGVLTNQKKESERELSNLRQSLQSHESSLTNYKNSLEVEKKHLEWAVDVLNRMKRRKKRRANINGIVGWIPGLPGIHNMADASKAVDRADEVVRNSQSQIECYSIKVAEYQLQISQAQANIERVDKWINLDKLENKLRDTPTVRNLIANVQGQFRHAIVQLEQLCNVSSAAELQTRYSIVVEPLIDVMQNMTTALGQITRTDLLSSEGISYLMDKIQRNHNRLVEQQRNVIGSDVVLPNDTDKFDQC